MLVVLVVLVYLFVDLCGVVWGFSKVRHRMTEEQRNDVFRKEFGKATPIWGGGLQQKDA